MSKINKTRLARGTKLTREHIYGPVSDANNELVNATLDENNLPYWGNFRINWNIPYVSGRWFSTDYADATTDPLTTTDEGKPKRSIMFPLVFPPFQELVANGEGFITGKNSGLQNDFHLDSITIGWDTRGEPRALQDGYNQTYRHSTVLPEFYGQLGLKPSEAARQEITVSIMTKELWALNDADNTDHRLKKVVTSFTIPGAAFTSPDFRDNPFTLTNINETLDPFQTYCLVIECPFLDPRVYYPDDATLGALGTAYFALHNLTCSVRVKTSLHSRTLNSIATVTDKLQNAPNMTAVRNAGTDGTVIAPVPGNNISAERDAGGEKGVQTNLNVVDLELNKKLSAGMDRESQQATKSAISADSCYDIIVVPMFSNKDDIRRCDVLAANSSPQSSGQNDNAGYNKAAVVGTLVDPVTPGIGTADDFESGGLPFVTAAQDEQTIDSRIIPISYPFELHYVFAHQNGFSPQVSYDWTGADPNALIPKSGWNHRYYTGVHPAVVPVGYIMGTPISSADITTEIGVAIGNGIKGEGYTFQQLAYCKFNHTNATVLGVPSKDEFVIDRIQHIDEYVLTPSFANISAGVNLDYQHEILEVPLVTDATATGVGYKAHGNTANNKNGLPIFVGEGNSNASGFVYNRTTDVPGRTKIGTDNSWQQMTGVAPTLRIPFTHGGEQYIEVRWKISTPAGGSLHQTTGDFVGAGGSDQQTAFDLTTQEVLVGAGGHFVYLVGKKYFINDQTGEKGE